MIDNKTKAAVLREFADNMSEPGVDRSVYELARSEADKLDPPEKPIHPHNGCDGMVIVDKHSGKSYVFNVSSHIGKSCMQIPREPSKVPAFLCDGTRPDWVDDKCYVMFINPPGIIRRAAVYNWDVRDGEYFCVINPIEVQ